MSDKMTIKKNAPVFHTMLEPNAKPFTPRKEFDMFGDGSKPEKITISGLKKIASEVKNYFPDDLKMLILDFAVHNTVEVTGSKVQDLEQISGRLSGLVTRIIQMPSKRNPEKVQKMMKFLSSSKLVRNIEFVYRGCLGNMSDNMRLQVIAALKSNPWIQNLNLSHNDLQDSHIPEIIEILSANHSLKRLGLASNSINNPRTLLSALIGHDSMEMLDISRNRIPHLSQGTVDAMPAFKPFHINISNQL